MSETMRPLRVCHVMSADLWGGAEVQVATVASYLASHVQLSAVLFNEGRLAAELRAIGVEVEVLDEARHGSVALTAQLRRFLRHRRCGSHAFGARLVSQHLAHDLANAIQVAGDKLQARVPE